MEKSGNILFYLIVVYILAAGAWWSYLLHSKNQEAERAQLSNLRYRLEARGTAEIKKDPEYTAILRRYQRQKWMIIGEGSVFMLILLLGLWRIYQIRQKELALALQQQNFLLSITHELKSPIASVQLVLETIQKRQLTIEQLQRLTQNGLNDSERLHRLVQDLLLAARVEGGYVYSFDKVNMQDLLLECIAWVRPKYSGKIVFEAPDMPLILEKGEYSTLSTAFSNLLENAVKYSDGAGTIVLKLYQKKEQLVVEIADEGLGIPKGERQKIFTKFYRVGSEATRKTKGTGLGLYIVKKVIAAHQGTVFVKDNQPKGTVFVVQL